MSSTPFNVGLGEGSRLSSRVLRPPGGGHTDIFGVSSEPEPIRGRRQNPATLSESPINTTNGTPIVETQNGSANKEIQNGHSSPEDPQPMPPPTDKAVSAPETTVAAEQKPELPKRVRVPPGGFSTPLW